MNAHTKGFYYKVSPERIRWWRSVSAAHKLEWLAEANAFLRLALTKEQRLILERFRKGENPTQLVSK